MNQPFNNLITSAKRINGLVFIPAMLMFILIFMTPSLFAEEKEERWFEFEVILFKLKSEDGLYAESWKDGSKLNISEDAIDFLQPYEVLKLVSELETSELAGKNNPLESEKTDAVSADDTKTIFREVGELEKSEGVSEQPFIRLPKNLLQLTSESKSIKRQSRYQLIEHFSWRQPVDSRANATKIRVAGGFNYSEQFEYNGEKKIEFIPIIDETIKTDEILDNKLTANLNALQQKEDLSKLLTNEEAKPLDWVPEIDGEIKVYIHRNYLHVDANLVYRKPEEITVDIFHLDEQPLGYTFTNKNSLEQSLLQNQTLNSITLELDMVEPNTLEPNNLKANPLPQISLSQSSSKNNTFSEPSPQFNWEFDPDFLNKKAEKLFTQKLFNYPLIQERRVRSGELHYFDHPLIGMLIVIHPYETEIFEDELIEPENLEVSD